MDIQTILPFIGVLGLGGAIGAYIQHLLNKQRETDTKIQNLNVGKYQSDLVFMRCVLKPENVAQFHINDPNIEKLKTTKDVQEYAQEKLCECYYSSLLYSSDEVLVNLKEFVENPTEANFTNTALSMRKDLWGKRTHLTPDDFSLKPRNTTAQKN